jgi:hypothetical protein
MDDRESLIFPNLYDYFVTQKNIYKILPIVNREKKKSNVSLSILDWFVTNYSKKYGTSYILNKKNFDVFVEYKAQLTDYGKKYFDPFNRSGPILCLNYPSNGKGQCDNCKNDHSKSHCDKGENIYTTFKQLNFLKWALKNKVIKYVEENVESISADYQNSKNMRASNKKEPKRVEVKKEIITVNVSKRVIKFNR